MGVDSILSLGMIKNLNLNLGMARNLNSSPIKVGNLSMDLATRENKNKVLTKMVGVNLNMEEGPHTVLGFE